MDQRDTESLSVGSGDDAIVDDTGDGLLEYESRESFWKVGYLMNVKLTIHTT